MRNISFAMTTAQFLNGSKTVTRRLGWRFLKAGTRLMGVKKAMGLKHGEKIEHLGEIEVLSVRCERLDAIRDGDPEREGFPSVSAAEFVRMFSKHMGCKPETIVTRIEFRRVNP